MFCYVYEATVLFIKCIWYNRWVIFQTVSGETTITKRNIDGMCELMKPYESECQHQALNLTVRMYSKKNENM